jgi:glutamyl-tRNA reductase
LAATFLVIGLNHRTASDALRARFWIAEARRYQALVELCGADGIEEAIVLVTCDRTEFVLWASDPACASNSVLAFLTREYGLRMSEWRSFYRRVDEGAVQHVFRVASGLDSRILGELEVEAHLMAAWRQAQQIGCSGRALDSLLAHAAWASKRVRAAESAVAAEEIVEQEVGRFCTKIETMDTVTLLQTLRARFDDLARLELEQVREEAGPLPTEHEQWMETLARRIAQRITNAMVRQLNQAKNKDQQNQLTAAIQHLLRTERVAKVLGSAHN